jgi:hypothetical protein
MQVTEAIKPPLNRSGITPAWLTRALAARHPGAVVGDAVFGTPIHGTGTNMRITLEYARQPAGDALPPTMWLKSCYEPHFESMAPSRVFEMEALFYRDLAARLDVRAPHHYYAGIDEDTHQGVMLLEDLETAGAMFGNATRPITPDLCARGLELLARLHASSWGQSWPRDLWYVVPGLQLTGPNSVWYNQQTPQAFRRFIAERAEANTPASVNDPDRIIAAFRKLAEISTEQPTCLIHSDGHLDNFYFGPENQEPGLFDWQAPRLGSWAWDVSYFIISALHIPDRRAHERQLLRHYLGALAGQGVDAPDMDTAWLAYRRYNAYGLFVKIVNPDFFKPREINVAWMSRHVAATEDLDTFASLGV